MRKIYKLSFTVFSFLLITSSLFAQNYFFKDAGENKTVTTSGERMIIPQKFRTSSLNVNAMKNFLWALPEESVINQNRQGLPIISLPMPDGSMAKFKVWESSVMEPGLAAKYHEIKTFVGQGIDDPYATIRMDYNPYFGFHAQILSPSGRIVIDPYARYDINNYISYYTREITPTDFFVCDVPEPITSAQRIAAGPCRGTQLLTYRLALACTGEYAVAVAGASPTKPAVLAQMVTAINRVTGVYEQEVSVRLTLIANTDLLIYLVGASDPYTNNDGGAMLGQNQSNIDAIIENANYDIGHVFSTGGGGIAGLGVVCRTGLKARGVTGLPNPVGDGFYIDYVAHEMGHQFGGNHTFNSSSGSCGGGNRNGSTAYEVGSGTTIMAYAGICGSDNIQPNSDPFFHSVSFDEIGTYITSGSGSCPAPVATGNSLPVITAMNNNGANIPLNTPFTLSGTATDADNDPLTYSWEEWDLGPSTTWNGGNANTTSPLFKSRIPKTDGNRTFPDMAVILASYPSNPSASMGGLKGETLPTKARALKFRLTVRDNRAGGGGVVTGGSGCGAFSSTFQVNTIAGTGPFSVTFPNGGETVTNGSVQTITWDVAGTNVAPIGTSNVKISLSTDGGITYTVIAASTANDGSEDITLPCITSSTARIKIEAIGNIYFDISNNNFSLQQGFDFNNPASVVAPCPVPASMSQTIGSFAACGFSNTINLSASGNPPGTTVSFSPATITPGASATVTLNGTNTLAGGDYIITVTGTATGAPVKSRQITFTIPSINAPAISAQPSIQTVCTGSNAIFSVTANNVSAYQWQVSTSSVPAFTDIPGATSATYTISPVSIGMNGNLYRVIVSNCATSLTSDAVGLNIITPVSITTQPTDEEICSGSSTSFSVAGNSSQPVTYQWQVNTGSGYSNVANVAPYSGATTATLTITNAGTTMNGYSYRALLSNTTCTVPVISGQAALTVRQLPTIGLTASLNSLLPGQVSVLTATPSAQTSGTLNTTWIMNGNVISNTGNTRNVNVENVGTYLVTIHETFGSGLVCSNQSDEVIIEATASSRLFIFPSPNDGNFTVSYYNDGGASTQRKIIIVDSKGSVVYSRQFPVTGAYTLIPINLESSSRGIYYVVVGDASGKKLAEGKVHIR